MVEHAMFFGFRDKMCLPVIAEGSSCDATSRKDKERSTDKNAGPRTN